MVNGYDAMALNGMQNGGGKHRHSSYAAVFIYLPWVSLPFCI